MSAGSDGPPERLLHVVSSSRSEEHAPSSGPAKQTVLISFERGRPRTGGGFGVLSHGHLVGGPSLEPQLDLSSMTGHCGGMPGFCDSKDLCFSEVQFCQLTGFSDAQDGRRELTSEKYLGSHSALLMQS